MQYQTIVRTLMEQYGQSMELRQSGRTHRVRAFLQPLHYKSRMYLEGTPTDLGFAGQNYFLYLGPAALALQSGEPGARVVCRDSAYEIRHCEAICFGEEPLYQRAVLRKVVEEASDGLFE